MSSSAKIVLGIVVLGAIAWAVWNYSHDTRSTTSDSQEPTPALTSGTSNSDLDTDMATIDAQLEVVSESSTEVDQSMNDTPTK